MAKEKVELMNNIPDFNAAKDGLSVKQFINRVESYKALGNWNEGNTITIAKLKRVGKSLKRVC